MSYLFLSLIVSKFFNLIEIILLKCLFPKITIKELTKYRKKTKRIFYPSFSKNKINDS